MTGRVLLVEPDPALRRVMEVNLTARGYQVDLATTGASALASAGHRPDLVILDLGLPHQDGAEVVASLRALSDVPILVILEDIRAADALRAGADDYLVKPFGIDKLVARARAALCRSPEGGGGVGQEGAEADAGCAIMG
jgi:two-component system, OmpR family, KDP operon response regulator KdpE